MTNRANQNWPGDEVHNITEDEIAIHGKACAICNEAADVLTEWDTPMCQECYADMSR
jgi:hypothetical protein